MEVLKRVRMIPLALIGFYLSDGSAKCVDCVVVTVLETMKEMGTGFAIFPEDGRVVYAMKVSHAGKGLSS